MHLAPEDTHQGIDTTQNHAYYPPAPAAYHALPASQNRVVHASFLPGLSSMLHQQQQRFGAAPAQHIDRVNPSAISPYKPSNHNDARQELFAQDRAPPHPQFPVDQPPTFQENDGTCSPTLKHEMLQRDGPDLTVPEGSMASMLMMAPPVKSSRYLREIDRRIILSRIDRGEKQAALAKEYHVSRAAICNLKKHRDEVLSRTDENPFAKHPKKPRPAKRLAGSMPSTTSHVSLENADTTSTRVFELRTRSVALLLTTLCKPTTKSAEFRRCMDRMIQLLMEQAIALLPTTTVEIPCNQNTVMPGMELQVSLCAISMEQVGCPLLDMFHLLEPERPTGYVRIEQERDGTFMPISILDAHLPSSLQSHHVLVFDIHVASMDAITNVVESLLQRGVQEERIAIVTLFIDASISDALQARFPHVCIITVRIDAKPQSACNDTTGNNDAGTSTVSPVSILLSRIKEAYH